MRELRFGDVVEWDNLASHPAPRWMVISGPNPIDGMRMAVWLGADDKHNYKGLTDLIGVGDDYEHDVRLLTENEE